MDFPLTLEYKALCDSEQALSDRLERLLEDERLKEQKRRRKNTHKKKRHSRIKAQQKEEEETNQSKLVNHYKKLKKQLNVSSTVNAVNEERQFSSIRVYKAEELYDQQNILRN